MKPDKYFTAAAGIVVTAITLIAMTWIGTTRAIYTQRLENTARVTATLTNQALTFTEQINRQILALDQTLRILVTAWESDPRHFDLEAWRTRAVVLSGLSRDMLLTDENGIIRQSSVNEAINQNASGQDYFRTLSDPSDSGDRMFIGAATIDGIMRQWHMNAARSLHYPDGSFAGVIDADYRITAITDIFNQTDLGAGAFMTLAGLNDGKLRGAVGPATVDPDANVGDTPMFAAIRNSTSGIWIGASPGDAVRRIHAFRHLPGRNLAVVVAMNEDEAMRPATVWRQQAQLFAGGITALLTLLALVLVHGTRLARRQQALVAENRATLAASNAQFEVARAFSAAKVEQLEATLAGMSDGVSMIDAHMCLVEWNARFPEIAGVPPEILRVGLPMEEILRAQIRTGQFGWIIDPEVEVARRMARLHVAPFGVTQRQRPDGHTLELRRNRLPYGGFVTLYVDITEHKLAEETLRKATAAAETANREKSRFVAIVSHEIRTPLNALLNTIMLLSDSVLAPAQRSLVATARQSGDALLGLLSDILDLSQMEAGKLSLRPGLFALRPLLESSAEMFSVQAAERGITIHVVIAEGTPDMLLTDPVRLRQVQLNLLSNAVRYARPGNVWLTAEPGHGTHEAIRLSVRDEGPLIAPGARERLFHPFSRLDRPGGDDPAGTGLGLSICRHLVTLMRGDIGCEAWRPGRQKSGDAGSCDERTISDVWGNDVWGVETSGDEREGNTFWIALPADALPFGAAPAGLDIATGAIGRVSLPVAAPVVEIGQVPRRSPPRTRILLTENLVADQLVTATLLRREGHHVDIAASGAAAIQAIQEAPYDMVFVDIFMPGMSGQEATQIIRALPEPARSTPIVALTTNIGVVDEALFKSIGMNGVLGKPVSVAELLAALQRHVWSSPVASNQPAGSQAVAGQDEWSRAKTSGQIAAAATPILATDRINELRSNLPIETFADLIEQCLVDMDHRLPALRRALVAEAPAAVTAHAHALVGMAAGYGMAALEARLRTIMAAAREGNIAPLGQTMVAALQTDFTEAAKALRNMLRSEVV